jgi:hypothetical protein
LRAAYFGDVFFFVTVPALPFSLIAIPAGAAHPSLDQEEEVEADVEDDDDEDVTRSLDVAQPVTTRVQVLLEALVTPSAVTAVTQVGVAVAGLVSAVGSAAMKRRMVRRDIALLLPVRGTTL